MQDDDTDPAAVLLTRAQLRLLQAMLVGFRHPTGVQIQKRLDEVFVPKGSPEYPVALQLVDILERGV